MSTISSTAPVSLPSAPPQPNAAVFPVQDLWLFRTYTRDSYRAAFGVEAPAWDPSRLTKSWFDSTVDTSDASNVAVYKTLGKDASGYWTLKQMVIPAQEAATVNLTGTVSYPPYVVAPTDATRGVDPSGRGLAMNPSYLALQSDAIALMQAVGGSGLVDQAQNGDPANAVQPIIYPASEPRRLWYFLFKGQIQYVGLLLMNRNALGVGSPGQWDVSGSQPVWVPAPAAPTGLNDTRPPRDIPMRALLPNEQLQTGLMGPTVLRTDLQQAAEEASGQFTADDRATLQKIYQILTK